MRTPVSSEPRRFSLKDDTCFSGIRLDPEDRRLNGGGYLNPYISDRLIPAHWAMRLPEPGEGVEGEAGELPTSSTRSS